MLWYFSKIRDAVVIQGAAEGPDTIGDAQVILKKGDDAFYGLTFEELEKADAGAIKVEDNVARIVE